MRTALVRLLYTNMLTGFSYSSDEMTIGRAFLTGASNTGDEELKAIDYCKLAAGQYITTVQTKPRISPTILGEASLACLRTLLSGEKVVSCVIRRRLQSIRLEQYY